jgi:hypothetical protein
LGVDKVKKTIEKKLDKVFSQYIRLRDTEEMDGIRVGVCCSSGKRITYEQGDAGHFINRKWRATRWHEENVHLQSISDNRFNEGNPAGYALFMIEKYGKEHVEYLLALSRERAGFTDSDGELMIKEYKKKIKGLKT